MKGPDSIEDNLEVSRGWTGKEAFKNPLTPDSYGVLLLGRRAIV